MVLSIAFSVGFLFFFVLFYFFIKKSEKTFSDRFKILSSFLVEKNHKYFFDLAKVYFEKNKTEAKDELQKRCDELESIITPVQESLKKMNEYNKEIEENRKNDVLSLNKQLNTLMHSENLLRKETYNLSRALKSPNVRGSWGQIHLRRVVELSGMIKNCDFFEQESKFLDKKKYIPDLVVKLPGKRQIIVDAKTPIDSYLEAFHTEDDNLKKEKMKNHANHLKTHVKALSSKEYWKCFKPSPEYVILFLPAEAFFSSAVQEDPTLLEKAFEKNIIIATPTTLIAILKAIAYAWKEENVSKNVKKIASLGREIYDGLNLINTNFEKVGKNLENSLDLYNKTINSFKRKVFLKVEKLKELEEKAFSKKEKENLDEIRESSNSIIK